MEGRIGPLACKSKGKRRKGKKEGKGRKERRLEESMG